MSESENILKRLLNRLKPRSGRGGHSPQGTTNGSAEFIRSLMLALQITEEIELTCDEVFALLDQYTESACLGEDLSQLMPLVDRHISLCGDCREEFEALTRIITAAATAEEQG